LTLYVLPPTPIEIAHQLVIRNLEVGFATEPDIKQVAGSWTRLTSDDQAKVEPSINLGRVHAGQHHWENTCTNPDWYASGTMAQCVPTIVSCVMRKPP
jgi:hypothetical protein